MACTFLVNIQKLRNAQPLKIQAPTTLVERGWSENNTTVWRVSSWCLILKMPRIGLLKTTSTGIPTIDLFQPRYQPDCRLPHGTHLFTIYGGSHPRFIHRQSRWFYSHVFSVQIWNWSNIYLVQENEVNGTIDATEWISIFENYVFLLMSFGIEGKRKMRTLCWRRKWQMGMKDEEKEVKI